MKFGSLGNKGFHITLPNGITLSVQFGPCNYCEHYDAYKDIGLPREKDKWESMDAEMAAWWDVDRKWIDLDTMKLIDEGSDVVGYKTVADFLEIINKLSQLKRDAKP